MVSEVSDISIRVSHVSVSNPPDSFLCPVTRLLMEHPVTTANGNTFEYAAIARWLSSHDTDPATNEVLKSKTLSKALLVRSLIQDWVASNPHVAPKFRNKNAVEPPDDMSGSGDQQASQGSSMHVSASLTNEASLHKVLTYKGASAKPTKAQQRAAAPPAVTSAATGCTYEFGRGPSGTQVRLDGHGAWVSSPDLRATSVFTTPQGLIFFDPQELHEVRVTSEGGGGPSGGDTTAAECKFKGSCTNRTCKYSHPFACRFGTQCKDPDGCKFRHPDPSSVVPLGDTFPLSRECKYSVACTQKGCHFAHPKGRLGRSSPRVQKALFATHNPDLTPLAGGPVAVDMGTAPRDATHFSFQGEFVFFYVPYPGAWAKEHFQAVTVHRFDGAKSQRYQKVGDYNLDGHYCNAAVGSHQYFLLSWWPFEDEAMRAHWEASRQLRVQGKSLQSAERDAARLRQALQAKDAELAGKDSTIVGLRAAVQRKDAQIARAHQQRQQEHKARQQRRQDQAAERASRQALRRQQEATWRRQRRSAAAARSERFRMRDPIHVYALAGNTSGTKAADWHLVLDYHKGAHGLEIFAPHGAEHAQRLKVTEGEVVFEFDLVVPGDLSSLGPLPIVPGRLCEGF
jgi:hypothetical protein